MNATGILNMCSGQNMDCTASSLGDGRMVINPSSWGFLHLLRECFHLFAMAHVNNMHNVWGVFYVEYRVILGLLS